MIKYVEISIVQRLAPMIITSQQMNRVFYIKLNSFLTINSNIDKNLRKPCFFWLHFAFFLTKKIKVSDRDFTFFQVYIIFDFLSNFYIPIGIYSFFEKVNLYRVHDVNSNLKKNLINFIKWIDISKIFIPINFFYIFFWL